MNKILLLTSASVFAICFGAQAGAVPPVMSTLEDLCGETVSVDTMVVNTVEDITETSPTCEIELADDAKLSIKNADIAFADELMIFGDGDLHIVNAWVDLKAVELNLSSGDIVITNSHIDAEDSGTFPIFGVNTGSGNIDLRNNDFSSADPGGGGDLDISSTTGDIAAVGNDFDVGADLNVESMGGNVEFKANTGVVLGDLRPEGHDVTVKGNNIDVGDSVVFNADGNLQVKNNNFGNSHQPIVVGGPSSCDIKNNLPAVSTLGCP